MAHELLSVLINALENACDQVRERVDLSKETRNLAWDRSRAKRQGLAYRQVMVKVPMQPPKLASDINGVTEVRFVAETTLVIYEPSITYQGPKWDNGVRDIRLGKNSQMANATPVPISCFFSDRSDGYGIETWKPGQPLIVEIELTAEESRGWEGKDGDRRGEFIVTGLTESR